MYAYDTERIQRQWARQCKAALQIDNGQLLAKIMTVQRLRRSSLNEELIRGDHWVVVRDPDVGLVKCSM